MATIKIPNTDSIEELAHFWDSHELTEVEDLLETVDESVFERTASGRVQLSLSPDQLESLHLLAEAKQMSLSDLVHQWVLEKLSELSHAEPAKVSGH